MRKVLNILLVCFLFLAGSLCLSNAQDQVEIDSLEKALQSNHHDTTKVYILSRLSYNYGRKDPQKSIEYGKRALQIARSNNYTYGISISANSIGVAHYYKGEMYKTLEYFLMALEQRKLLNDERAVATSYNNIANVYRELGNYTLSLEYFFNALRMQEDLDAKREMAMTMNNIASSYNVLMQYDKGIEFAMAALKINEEINDESGKANAMSTLGSSYNFLKKYRQSIDYHVQSLKIKKTMGNKFGIANTLNNLGLAYRDSGDYKSALTYYKASLKIKKETGNLMGIARSNMNIGSSYYMLGKNDSAINYLNKCLVISEKGNYHAISSLAFQHLSEIYADNNNYKTAFEYRELFTKVKDSLFNEEKSKEIGKLEARYEMEKKIAEDKRAAEDIARVEAEKEARRNNLQYSGILIFIVALFMVVLWGSKHTSFLNVRFTEGLVFFTFLLFFEFALVLLDPYIERLSAGSPALKLTFNAILAALIFPMHQFFETVLKRKALSVKEKNIHN